MASRHTAALAPAVAPAAPRSPGGHCAPVFESQEESLDPWRWAGWLEWRVPGLATALSSEVCGAPAGRGPSDEPVRRAAARE